MTRRSGRQRRRSARCSAIGSPRTRIALQPPPQDLMSSGRRPPTQRSGAIQLRDVSAEPCARPTSRAERARAIPGGPPAAARRPTPIRRSPTRTRAEEDGRAVAPRGRERGSSVSTRMRRDTLPACPATSSPAASSRAPISAGSSTAPPRSRRRRCPRARSRAGRSALLFQAPSTRTRLSFEAGVFELGGHPLVLRETEMQLSRGESLEDTARVFPPRRGVRRADHVACGDRGARGGVRRPGLQHAHRAAPPVPGARRPPDDARGVRPRRGAQDRLRRRRQQRRAFARACSARSPAWRSPIASPRGLRARRRARSRGCS